MPVKVYYNNQVISGEPFVSRSFTPMDYGDRWGMTETITLNGVFSGGLYEPLRVDHNNPVCSDNQHTTELACTGAGETWGPNVYHDKTTGLATHITDIFKENFKPLKVYDNNSLIPYYDIPSCSVEDITFDKSKWQIGTPLKYTVKLKAYDIFHVDTVVDPEDSYAFTEGDDGSVTVTHKVSAKGIKSGTLSPLQRAITFVDKFVGIDHFGVCDPIFMASRKPVLLSKSENINRLEGTYSVTENYRYHSDATGDQPHLKTHKLTQNRDSSADFHTVDYDIEYQTDDTHGIDSLRRVINNETAAGARTYEKYVAAELLGGAANHDKVYQVSVTLNEDQASNKITVKTQYQTGMANLTEGYFDYKVNFSKDEVTQVSTYSIDGEVQTFGNVESKKAIITTFKNLNYDNIETVLHTNVQNSQVFETFGNEACVACDNNAWAVNYASISACRVANGCTNRIISPYPNTIKWVENPNKGALTISAEFDDKDYLDNTVNTKYGVSVTSSKWTLKEIPSANVDGIYVLQDLMCKTTSNTKINTNGEVRHKGAYATSRPGPNDETVDILAHKELRDLTEDVAKLAVPDNTNLYPGQNSAFTKEKTEASDDITFPYSSTLSEAYLHSPTIKNTNIIMSAAGVTDPLYVMMGPFSPSTHGHQHIVNYTRGPGYKFGY